MDSELVAQRSSHPASRSQHLDANTIGIFTIYYNLPAVEKLKTKQLKDNPV